MYIVSTDVGGTCTDTVIFARDQPIHIGKALSTPPDFGRGVIDSIADAVAAMDATIEELLAETTLFMHGTTVVDNTILTRSGAPTGLVTTEGFEDVLLVTRGRLRPLGRPVRRPDQEPGQHRPRRPPGSVRAHPRRARARRLQGRGAGAARRVRGRSGGARPRRARRSRGHRRVLPVVVQQPGPRAPGARGRRAGGTRGVRHLLERHRARARRVRAHVDHRHQRLCRAHHLELPRRARHPARRARLPAAR